jgi:hypothetical protein
VRFVKQEYKIAVIKILVLHQPLEHKISHGMTYTEQSEDNQSVKKKKKKKKGHGCGKGIGGITAVGMKLRKKVSTYGEKCNNNENGGYQK